MKLKLVINYLKLQVEDAEEEVESIFEPGKEDKTANEETKNVEVQAPKEETKIDEDQAPREEKNDAEDQTPREEEKNIDQPNTRDINI